MQHIVTIIVSLVLAASAFAGETRLIDGEPFAAELLELSKSELKLAPADLSAASKRVPLANLLAWGELAPAAQRPTVVLRQGSRLIVAPAWSLEGSLRYADGAFTLRQTLLADARIERALVSTVWFEAVRDPVVFAPAIREAAQYDGPADRLWLANGDAFTGTLEQIERGQLTFAVEGQALSFALGEVVAVKLAEEPVAKKSSPPLAIGLRDGGLLLAEAATLEINNRLTVRLSDQLTLTGRREGAVTLVQPLGSIAAGRRVTYLSDLRPLDYRHTPYFDVPWGYRQDINLTGRPLEVAGRRWLKGLAMHSAARLVHRVELGARQFASEIAVEPPQSTDSAAMGSVVFRVFVARDGRFSPGYESPIVRYGDPPIAVSVDIAGAQAIALTVDYADGGDAGDHAVWLGARFVK